MSDPQLLCIMGPTASGKTPLALEIAERFPCEIISVDSALVYRGMDIGTAKPEQVIRERIPHHLIDIADPKDVYSAGQFRRDALAAIAEIREKNKLPILVGGTMMYFRILQKGLADLPVANKEIRAGLQEQAIQQGWEALHQQLFKIDPIAATRIHVNDAQRIQRALEVFMLTGKSITTWQESATAPLAGFDVRSIAITPRERSVLHQRIEQRFHRMLEQGFLEEVESLYARGDLSIELPSIRSVGYRQAWDYLASQCSFDEMVDKSIFATRQLAKRQLTWLRSWPSLTWYDTDSPHYLNKVLEFVKEMLS